MEGHSSREMKAERMRSEIKKRQKKKGGKGIIGHSS